MCGTRLALDGADWLVATDPDNAGRAQEWWKAPRPGAKPTRVPGVIQEVFPDYHGVVWYWREFRAPRNPDLQGRCLLRFWAVNYLADVWVNGVYVGGHEGSEIPFTLDATSAIRPTEHNLVAVRVLNPGNEPIDGIKLSEIPHRNQTTQFSCGCDYDHGGIEDSVELLVTPAVRVEDLFVRADPTTGLLKVQVNVRNTLARSVNGSLEISVAPATTGRTLAGGSFSTSFDAGDTRVEKQLRLENPRLWEIGDPFLYRISARATVGHSEFCDEHSTRCGFRELRLKNGYFHLNGRRIFWKSSVSGDMAPIGIHVPFDPDWFRRDLVNSKAMGFNAIRFYGLPTRVQLDLCDEIGLMVYEESFASQGFEDSPKMAGRFDRSTAGMIRRDRNHPSVVAWGLLNETGDGPQFRHAVKSLALVRSLDVSRLVFLSSGRFDRVLKIGSVCNPGSTGWECLLGDEGQDAPPKEKEPLIYPSCEGTGDAHLYPQVPHRADAIHLLRTFGQNTRHKRVFLSEYGVASAVNLVRVVREYEQRGKGDCGECRFYRRALDQFLADWKRWKMADCFGRPEDYFEQCLASMAGQRLVGINALRSNPCFIGYDLTGTSDQGYTGEGLTTAFRELKPGTVDAIFDGLAPLRWCLFAEPVNLYRGQPVKLQAVLANEDMLKAGVYPAQLEVFGPGARRVLRRKIDVKIAGSDRHPPPPLALPVFAEEVSADWPGGEYRLVATFERGAAAAGGNATFYVADPAEMPKVSAEVILWGEDLPLRHWLDVHGIPVRPF
ncbi:MAG: glycoside hydrolase family 2, partial [Verrucomicrobiota bacterium]|nr:glycoside hydrolase family 2 [Verrucomicrobiota bacterium]